MRKGLRTAVAIGSAYVASYGGAIGIDALGQSTPADVKANVKRLHASELTAQAATTKLTSLEEIIGAKCMLFIRAYSDGGSLHRKHASRKASVIQMIISPQQPCGDNPDNITSRLERYDTALSAKASASEEIEYSQRSLAQTRHSEQKSLADMAVAGTYEGLALFVPGSILFMFGGLALERRPDYSNRNIDA